MSEIWNRFGPTAARTHSKPGRTVRPASITIDVHSHVAVPEAANFVKPHLEIALMPLENFATPDTRALNQRQDADRASRMTQYDERLADLEAMGVDLQVVKPRPRNATTHVPIEIADKASRMVNDGLAEYVSRYPDRFIAFGTVPLQDGSAVRRARTLCEDAGLQGGANPDQCCGRELSDATFAPFWAKAEQLGVLVVLHPNGFTQADRLSAIILITSSEIRLIPASRCTI